MTVETNGKSGARPLSQLSQSELLEVIEAQNISADMLVESMADLQLQLEDAGWMQLTWDGRRPKGFRNDEIVKIIELTRAAYIANPLIGHAVEVQADYVMGQGVSIMAKPTEEVNETLQTFLDHPQNQKVLTSQQALWSREIQLRTEGNLFICLFTNAFTGEVNIRIIPPEEIINAGDPIYNPQDKSEPWFYRRQWWSYIYEPLTGRVTAEPEMHTAYYPDKDYQPDIRPDTINGDPVYWDAPIMHVKTGNISGECYGVPEIYKALNWARAVKLDMEDYATIRRALSRFAWRLHVKGGGARGVQQAKDKLHSALNEYGNDENPPPLAGSTAIMGEERDLQPFRLAGTTLNPEEGRRLWLLVAAGVSLPENILSGDTKAGALASARTLDRPTELHMRNRQVLWETVLRELSMYVLASSARSFGGIVQGDVLNGVIELAPQRTTPPNPTTGRQRPGRPRQNEIVRNKVEVVATFPPVLEKNAKENVGAVVDAATLAGRMSKDVFSMSEIRRRVLHALGENDIDGSMKRIEEELEDPEERAPKPVMTQSPFGGPRGAGGEQLPTTDNGRPTGRNIEPLTGGEDANSSRGT
jgi:hypothetical protein